MANGGAELPTFRFSVHAVPSALLLAALQPCFGRVLLGKSLIRYGLCGPWLGVDHLGMTNVKSWMLRSLERAHFYVPGDKHEVLAELEVYVGARVGSVFEGAA